jgi:hypothetical protein
MAKIVKSLGLDTRIICIDTWLGSSEHFFGADPSWRTSLCLSDGCYDDAEAILLAAIDRFPAEVWPAVEYASLAHTRQDWVAATTRWVEVRAGWPDRQVGYSRGAEALAALGRKDEAMLLWAKDQRRPGPLVN